MAKGTNHKKTQAQKERQAKRELRKLELHEERQSSFEKKKATAILEGRDPDDEQLSDPQASELESGIDDDDADSGGEDMEGIAPSIKY